MQLVSYVSIQHMPDEVKQNATEKDLVEISEISGSYKSSIGLHTESSG